MDRHRRVIYPPPLVLACPGSAAFRALGLMEAVIASEIELKLAVSEDDLAKIKAALLTMASRPGTAESELISTYYDTRDLALRRRALTLRIRRNGRQLVQTVKAASTHGGQPLERGEWEDPIAGQEPDLTAPMTGSRLPGGIASTDLQPLFRTKVTRLTIDLEPRPGTKIEAAIDQGEIHADAAGRSEPIREIELELKEGDPAALYDIALRLLEIAPIRLATSSKSERGYRLAEDAAAKPQAVHAPPPVLDPTMTVDGVLRQIGRGCLTHLIQNEGIALAGNPEAVHQMRVAIRRLRSALSALKPMLPPDHYRWASEELKWLGGELGAARNWDVFNSALLKPVRSALPYDEDLKQLASAADKRRKTAYQTARDAILSGRYTGSILRLARWFEVRGWRDQPVTEQSARLVAPIGDLAGTLLEQRHRSVRKRARHFKHATAPQRHKLRIAVKKLRYAIEFLGDLFDEHSVRLLLRDLKPLQECLGHFNDVKVAHDLLHELRGAGREGRAIDRAGGMVLGWHEHALAESADDLRHDVKRLVETKAFWSRGEI